MTQVFRRRILPTVLQLPVTSRCNSRCVTCNVWKQLGQADLPAEGLRKVLGDPFFRNVSSVGINGGEPFLHPDLIGVMDAVLTLPRIRTIYLISNGLLAQRIMQRLPSIMERCATRNVRLHLTVSIDGIGSTHDAERGVPGAFEKSWQAVESILQQRKKYCDELALGYTVSRWNAGDMEAVKALAERVGIQLDVHLAVPNRRIGTFDSADYSVLQDPRSMMLAREYFFSEFKYGRGLKHRMQSYFNYAYMVHGGERRYAYCNYLRQDVTVDENLKLYLCAAASEEVGDLSKHPASYYVKAGALRREEKKLEPHCGRCAHYIVYPSLSGALSFFGELLLPANWIVDEISAKALRMRRLRQPEGVSRSRTAAKSGADKGE